MTEPLRLPVIVNGVPVEALLTPEAMDTLRAALGTPAEDASPYVTPDEAAELLRCGRRRIYDLVADGRLSRHGDGRRLLVRREEVLRLAEGADTGVTPR
jgi:excisionase family DNA binding protein